MNQRLFLAVFFLLVLLMATLVLAFLTIPPKRSIMEVQKEVGGTPYELDYSSQFGPLTIITKLPGGTTTRTDVFDASGNKVY